MFGSKENLFISIHIIIIINRLDFLKPSRVEDPGFIQIMDPDKSFGPYRKAETCSLEVRQTTLMHKRSPGLNPVPISHNAPGALQAHCVILKYGFKKTQAKQTTANRKTKKLSFNAVLFAVIPHETMQLI